jgi:hypothetical protein
MTNRPRATRSFGVKNLVDSNLMAERIPLSSQGIRSTKTWLLHLQGICSHRVRTCPVLRAAGCY